MVHRHIAASILLGLVCSACSQESPASNSAEDNAPSNVASPSTPPKVYKVSDIEWEYADIGKSYREKVVAGINKVLRDNQRCADVQTTSLYPAKGFSKVKPIFFVICDAKGGGDPFGVTFNVNDVDTGKRFAAALVIKEADARRDCEEATQRDSNGLRDISFPIFAGNFIPHDDGRATIALSFTAKNALGIKDAYRVVCFFKGPAITEHDIKPS